MGASKKESSKKKKTAPSHEKADKCGEKKKKTKKGRT